jgi:hypothetical protein
MKNSFETLKSALPIMGGVLLMVSFLNIFLTKYYSQIFTNNSFLDPLIGNIAGSLSFGIPVTSYIIGGELLDEGVSLMTITAFIMSWTTVGVLMLPLESKFLGKKFAVIRNSINFIFSMIIAVLTVYTISFLNI